jgi:hypothetical protein
MRLRSARLNRVGRAAFLFSVKERKMEKKVIELSKRAERAMRKQAEQAMNKAWEFGRHAMTLESETNLLSKAGYFDAAGQRREDTEGHRIWEAVQKEMAALPPFTDAEVEVYLRTHQ